MKNKLWNIADTIVERLSTAIKTNPKESKNFSKDISKEYWFDYLEEELDEPEPPTLRPMSELPTPKSKQVLFKCYHEIEDVETWNTGWHDESELIRIGGILHRKSTGYKSKHGDSRVIGWLPLPNPNDIKIT